MTMKNKLILTTIILALSCTNNNLFYCTKASQQTQKIKKKSKKKKKKRVKNDKLHLVQISLNDDEQQTDNESVQLSVNRDGSGLSAWKKMSQAALNFFSWNYKENQQRQVEPSVSAQSMMQQQIPTPVGNVKKKPMIQRLHGYFGDASANFHEQIKLEDGFMGKATSFFIWKTFLTAKAITAAILTITGITTAVMTTVATVAKVGAAICALAAGGGIVGGAAAGGLAYITYKILSKFMGKGKAFTGSILVFLLTYLGITSFIIKWLKRKKRAKNKPKHEGEIGKRQQLIKSDIFSVFSKINKAKKEVQKIKKKANNLRNAFAVFGAVMAVLIISSIGYFFYEKRAKKGIKKGDKKPVAPPFGGGCNNSNIPPSELNSLDEIIVVSDDSVMTLTSPRPRKKLVPKPESSNVYMVDEETMLEDWAPDEEDARERFQAMEELQLATAERQKQRFRKETQMMRRQAKSELAESVVENAQGHLLNERIDDKTKENLIIIKKEAGVKNDNNMSIENLERRNEALMERPNAQNNVPFSERIKALRSLNEDQNAPNIMINIPDSLMSDQEQSESDNDDDEDNQDELDELQRQNMLLQQNILLREKKRLIEERNSLLRETQNSHYCGNNDSDSAVFDDLEMQNNNDDVAVQKPLTSWQKISRIGTKLFAANNHNNNNDNDNESAVFDYNENNEYHDDNDSDYL